MYLKVCQLTLFILHYMFTTPWCIVSKYRYSQIYFCLSSLQSNWSVSLQWINHSLCEPGGQVSYRAPVCQIRLESGPSMTGAVGGMLNAHACWAVWPAVNLNYPKQILNSIFSLGWTNVPNFDVILFVSLF